jgi:putative SOS response-associated peptidase YedK
MARRARVEYPGPLYHVIAPENQHQRKFHHFDSKIPSTSALLKPYPPEKMEGYDVSSLVNNPRDDSLECIRPVED